MVSEAVQPTSDDVRVPWEVRLVLALPGGPFASGALVATALVALHFGMQQAFLASPWPPLPGLEAQRGEANLGAVTFALLIGYVLAGFTYGLAASYRDLVESGLESPFRGEGAHVYALLPEALRRSRIAGAAGAILGLLLSLVPTVRHPEFVPEAVLSPYMWTHPFVWSWLYIPLLFWMVGRGAYLHLGDTQGTARFASESLPIDLLRLEPLARIGRRALRGALLWIVGATIAWLPVVLSRSSVDAVSMVLTAGVMGIAMLVFVVPVRSVHARIRVAKRAELRGLDDQIRLVRARSGRGLDPTPGRLADLLALRAHVADLPEWPFDTRTLRRFALYLMIPLGSWVAGALVERGIDWILN